MLDIKCLLRLKKVEKIIIPVWAELSLPCCVIHNGPWVSELLQLATAERHVTFTLCWALLTIAEEKANINAVGINWGSVTTESCLMPQLYVLMDFISSGFFQLVRQPKSFSMIFKGYKNCRKKKLYFVKVDFTYFGLMQREVKLFYFLN